MLGRRARALLATALTCAAPVSFAVPDGELPLYFGDDDVHGFVTLKAVKDGPVDHRGIDVLFEGKLTTLDESVEIFLQHIQHAVREPGRIEGELRVPFAFDAIDKPYEAYRGIHARIHYVIRVLVRQRLVADIERAFDIWVMRYQEPPARALRAKYDVGIREALEVAVQYSRTKFFVSDLDEPGDVIVGTLFFRQCRVPLTQIYLTLTRRETVHLGSNAHRQVTAVFCHEIADGCPLRGEVVPFRVFLKDYHLIPTVKELHNRLSVRYALCLVFKGEGGIRYYHQREIVIWRKAPSPCTLAARARLVLEAATADSSPIPAAQDANAATVSAYAAATTHPVHGTTRPGTDADAARASTHTDHATAPSQRDKGAAPHAGPSTSASGAASDQPAHASGLWTRHPLE